MEDFLIAARAVHYASTISLGGVFAFLCFVAGPEPPPRLGRRLLLLAWASLGLALVSGGAWLVFVAAQMSGEPLVETLGQGVVATVLSSTRFGQVWGLRLTLAVALAILLLAPRGWRGWLWRWAGLALGAGVLAMLAWGGHGGATPGAPGDLHLAADMLHLLAAGAWVGSLVPLALLLAETRHGSGDPAVAARPPVVRFSILAAVSVTLLFAGGLVNTWFLAGSVPALIGTEYGRLLLAKIAVFVTMVTFGSVNLLRMTPRLAPAAGARRSPTVAALGHLQRNALVEAGLGLCVLGIVAVLGILPPGLHTEPGWPLPFRLEWAALSAPSRVLLAIVAAFSAVLAAALVATAAAGRYRAAAAASAGLAVCLVAGWLAVRAAIEPAYPTTFFAPAEPYAAPSVARGARLYAENCALCHGAGGRGDGPAAAALTVRPADLTAPHLFAHPEGDLFWWVSHGKGGVMPGFAGVLRPADRWDVIDFVLARAAGVLSRQIGGEVSTAAAPAVPDFAFETGGGQQTLDQALRAGPVLLALFGEAPMPARIAQLASTQTRLADTKLRILVIDVGSTAATPDAAPEREPGSPVVAVAGEVTAALRSFYAPDDGGETDLMLDRAGRVRARWTAGGPAGLPADAALAADAVRVARFAAAPESHAGHVH
jgi:putative copper resistance protein D